MFFVMHWNYVMFLVCLRRPTKINCSTVIDLYVIEILAEHYYITGPSTFSNNRNGGKVGRTIELECTSCLGVINVMHGCYIQLPQVFVSYISKYNLDYRTHIGLDQIYIY